MIKRLAVILAALFLTMAGTLVVKPYPAAAATCQSSHLCVYSGAAFTGSLTRYGTAAPKNCKSLNGDTMNNNAESMVNGSNRFIRFYNSHNCTGSILGWLHAAGGAVDERSSLPGWANVISSWLDCSDPSCSS